MYLNNLGPGHLSHHNLKILNAEVIDYSKIQSYNSAVKTISDEKDVLNVIDLKEYFCTDGVCQVAKDGFPLYDDDNHISFLGSRIIWNHIFDLLQTSDDK